MFSVAVHSPNAFVPIFLRLRGRVMLVSAEQP